MKPLAPIYSAITCLALKRLCNPLLRSGNNFFNTLHSHPSHLEFSPHGKGVTFAIRSAPVGYAAEYLTCGSLVAIPMGFSLHMFMRVLYHICISIPSGGRSVLPTFWNIWYNCLIKLNACWFVRTKSLLSLDNGPRAGCGKVNLPRPVCGMLSGCSGPRMDILHRAPRLFLAASKRL